MATWDQGVAEGVALGGQALVESFYDMGMSMNHIAELAGASASTVRKWRRGTVEAAPSQRLALAELAAALDLVRGAGVDDPAAWLETPVVIDGVSVRPLDLALNGGIRSLPSIVGDPSGLAAAMDRFDPGWRRRRWSGFEVFIDTDGHRSIRFAEASDK